MVRHLSPAPIQMLDHWPMWETMAQFEETFNWPTQQAGPSNNILEFIPGAHCNTKSTSSCLHVTFRTPFLHAVACLCMCLKVPWLCSRLMLKR